MSLARTYYRCQDILSVQQAVEQVLVQVVRVKGDCPVPHAARLISQKRSDTKADSRTRVVEEGLEKMFGLAYGDTIVASGGLHAAFKRLSV